jgi:hypothetical protein
MRETDFDAFTANLDAACDLLSRGTYRPNATSAALWFRSLARYDLGTVQAALDAHVLDPQRGRFVPTPADLIAQIDGSAADDGRPGPEEAWAVALRSTNEAETVVWTAEIAEAIGIARPVLEAGDEVGARMAFREAYVRLVDAARRQHMPAAWTASLGFDHRLRAVAITAAVAAGRLPASDLPRLPGPSVALLQLGEASGCPPHVRQQLRELADRLRAALPPESADAAAKRETDELKARSARLVAAVDPKVVAEYERQRAAMRAELDLEEEGDVQSGKSA